jgi:hypothetical protein
MHKALQRAIALKICGRKNQGCDNESQSADKLGGLYVSFDYQCNLSIAYLPFPASRFVEGW